MDKVVHFEIPADDVSRAIEFYKKVFGWHIEKYPMPDPDIEYYGVRTVETDDKGMPKSPGAINGGLMTRQQETQPVIVINVNSIDEYIKKVKKSGGQVVMEKVPVMDMGLYARVTDTEGNLIGLWEDIKKGGS